MPKSIPPSDFTLLKNWYTENHRSMPWRQTRDPYAIWLSEVILQQTRVAQGWAYFERFLATYPTVHDLAAAPRDAVLKLWEGLGYYTRAHSLHTAAQQVVTEHGGQFPQTWEGLIQLKGVGPYTARAIASLAFGQRVGVLDGNVFRVLARYHADVTPVDTPTSRAHYQPLADAWVQTENPAVMNQALMELGALVCLPRNPQCSKCPLQPTCKAAAGGSPTAFPVKGKAKARDLRHYLFYWYEDAAGRLYLRQRPATGLWKGLWELPNVQVEAPAKGQQLATLRHAFTHFDMAIQLLPGGADAETAYPGGRWCSPAEVELLALPRAVQLLIAQMRGGGRQLTLL
jgi:A/G-specific adenine glycosylase